MARVASRWSAGFVLVVAGVLAMGCDGTISLEIKYPKDGQHFQSSGEYTVSIVIDVHAEIPEQRDCAESKGYVYINNSTEAVASWSKKWEGQSEVWAHVVIPDVVLKKGENIIRCVSQNEEGDDTVTVNVDNIPDPPDINPSDGGSASNNIPHDPNIGCVPMYGVVPFSGEVYYQKTDVVLKGRGFDFAWTRTYRSREPNSSAMGEQWDFSYNLRLESVDGYLKLHNGSGSTIFFIPSSQGEWTAYGYPRVLTYDSTGQGQYTMTFPDGTRWLFYNTGSSAQSGRPFQIIDRNGNHLDLQWNETTGLLDSVVDTLGRQIQLTYDQGRITSLSDAQGSLVTYTYYGNNEPNGMLGDLKSATCRAVTGAPNGNDFPNGKTWTYEYSRAMGHEELNHNLTAIRDAKGNIHREYTYFLESNEAQPRFDRVAIEWRNGGRVDYFYGGMSGGAYIFPDYWAYTMTSIKDEVGNVEEQYYDEENRLVVRLQYTGRAPNPDEYSSPGHNEPFGQLRSTDPQYYVTKYEYDSSGRRISEISPGGSEVKYTYAPGEDGPFAVNNVVKVTYNPGDCGGEPGSITRVFDYEPNSDKVKKVTDGRGGDTTYTFDTANGNLLRIDYPSGSASMTFVYNTYGQPVQVTNPTGRVDTYSYQDGYLHQKIVDSGRLNLETTYGCNSYGEITSETDPRGNTTTYIRNQLNQVVRQIAPAPLNYQTDYFYDENDNVARVDVQNVDREGNVGSNSHYSTIYVRNTLDQVVQMSQEVANGQDVVTEYEYDLKGQVTAVISGEATNGHQATNTFNKEYDERNLVFKEIRGPNDVQLHSTTQYDYDLNGNLEHMRQGTESSAPRIWQYASDGYNRRITQTDPEGNVTTYEYDANGNCTRMRVDGERIEGESGSNVRLAEEKYFYDPMNRLYQKDVAFFGATGQTLGDGWATTTWSYDAGGNVVGIQDDNGKVITQTYDTADRLWVQSDSKENSREFTRDGNGNVTIVTETEKSEFFGDSTSYVTTNIYDARNRLISTTDNADNEQEFGYDSLNNRTLWIDARGNETTYDFDGLKRLIVTTRVLTDTGTGQGNQIGTIVTTQSWDNNSRLTSQTDPNGHGTTYAYDPLNRLTGITYADGTTNTFQYDVHDNRTSVQDGNGSVVSNTYDLMNRLTARSIARAAGVYGATSESYKYDGLGRCVYARNTEGETTLSTVTLGYNSLGRVEAQTLNGKTVACTFDGVGNELTAGYPGGRTVSTAYDDLNRKHTISSNQGGSQNGALATYYYVGPQRVQGAIFGNNVGLMVAYDDARRITDMRYWVDPFGDPYTIEQRTIDHRTYAWDPSGNKTSRTNAKTGLVHTFSYDSVNRMSASSLSTTPPVNIAYALDPTGNRTTVTGGDNPGTYTMSATDPPADANMNQYTTTPMDDRTYDNNGNLASRTGTVPPAGTFAYDYKNRMVRFTETISGKRHDYVYDCLGRLIKKVVDFGGSMESQTLYYYKGWQLIEERDDTDTVQATFVYGNYIDEVITMRRLNTDYYYVRDDQYNVMAIANSSGALVESYDYGDFGAPLNPTTRQVLTSSTVGNPFFFTGRLYDWQTGLYNYRTRYYDPIVGRFTSRDSIGIWGDELNMGNAFAYCGNNPWSLVDPHGMGEWREWGDSLVHAAWRVLYSDKELSEMTTGGTWVRGVGYSILGAAVIGGVCYGGGIALRFALGTGAAGASQQPTRIITFVEVNFNVRDWVWVRPPRWIPPSAWWWGDHRWN